MHLSKDTNNLKLNTTLLFFLLLKFLKVDLICDIGSMDGSSSLRFRKILPYVDIFAFEANPINFKSMQEDEKLVHQSLFIQNKAVWKSDGKIKFYMIPYSEKDVFKKGISSTRRRVLKNSDVDEVEVEVESVRLDNFILNLSKQYKHIALWIDVEGAAYEVLLGIKNIIDRVNLIHVEVETKRYWEDQKLKQDVENLTEEMGFHLLGRGLNEDQHDLVFVNQKNYEKNPLKYRLIVLSSLFFQHLLKIRRIILNVKMFR